MNEKMTRISDYCNFGSLLCVSVSMATMIQVLQIIMLILSIILTLAGIVGKIYVKIKNKTLTVDDINKAKEDIDKLADKVNNLKDKKDE